MIGPGSVVRIATGYGLDGRGIESRWRRDFPHLSRPVLGPTQPPVQWVPGLSRGVKSGRGVTLTPHPILVPWSWKSKAVPLLPLWAVRPVQSLSACTRGAQKKYYRDYYVICKTVRLLGVILLPTTCAGTKKSFGNTLFFWIRFCADLPQHFVYIACFLIAVILFLFLVLTLNVLPPTTVGARINP